MLLMGSCLAFGLIESAQAQLGRAAILLAQTTTAAAAVAAVAAASSTANGRATLMGAAGDAVSWEDSGESVASGGNSNISSTTLDRAAAAAAAASLATTTTTATTLTTMPAAEVAVATTIRQGFAGFGFGFDFDFERRLNGVGVGTATDGDWSSFLSPYMCHIWQPSHHLYFQLANVFFLFALLAPHRPLGMVWLRTLTLIGCILMAMHGYMVECAPDVLVWSTLSFIVNLIYLLILLCQLRPVRFDTEIEAAYTTLFAPLHVSRYQFKKILNCMKVIRALKYQEVYAQEKVTKVDSLSLVLSGKLVVSQHQRALHIVFPHQFLDSPEWFGVSTDDYFQVSIMAIEESRVLIWHRDKLKLSIIGEPFLQTVFDHILGRDVVKKLMQVTQVNESIASNGFLPTGGYADDGEDKPMLMFRKTIDVGHGLTALINRQLQEEHAPLLGRAFNQREEYAMTASIVPGATAVGNGNAYPLIANGKRHPNGPNYNYANTNGNCNNNNRTSIVTTTITTTTTTTTTTTNTTPNPINYHENLLNVGNNIAATETSFQSS